MSSQERSAETATSTANAESTTGAAAMASAVSPLDAQLASMHASDVGALAELLRAHPEQSSHIVATVASRMGNAAVQSALSLVRHQSTEGQATANTPVAAPGDDSAAGTPDVASAQKPKGILAGAETVLDRVLHGSIAHQVSQLTPAQRADYDAILASTAKTGHPADPESALKTAKMGRELSPEDRDAVRAVQQKVASLHVSTIDDHDPNQVQIEISFDGTWNDRDEMAFQTNPALLNELFAGPAENKIYEVGIGTSPDSKVLGGATGLGFHERIKDAYSKLVARVNEIKAKNPNANIVLVIAGFSRGSAAARAFANELNVRGMPDTSSPRGDDGSYQKQLAMPRIGAMMLFDTVGSLGLAGDERNYNLDGSKADLSIPKNAENVLHLTARDEKRKAFPLSSAVDPTRDDSRITELSMPGAHSDIGGGYPNAYSGLSLDLAVEYAQKAGVHMNAPDRAPIDVNDPRLRLHESRSDPEIKAFGPDEKRTVFDSSNPR